MNKKFALSVLSIFAIFLSATFANLVSADSTVRDLWLSKINNGIFDVSSPQATILVNYNFNDAIAGSMPCNPGTVTTTVGVSSIFTTSTGTCTTPTGTATTPTAFTQNAIGPAVSITGFAADATQFFQFQLGGQFLPRFGSYMVYFQGLRSGSGPSSATLQYSTDGTTFTNFQTVTVPTNATVTFDAFNFDLSSITALNNQPNVYFRIVGSGGSSNNGTFRIDNFQVQATEGTTGGTPTPTPTPTATPTATPTTTPLPTTAPRTRARARRTSSS